MISTLQIRILQQLQSRDSSSVAELARAIGILRPSVSRSLADLERAKLVERQGRICTLTAQGKQMAEGIAEEVRTSRIIPMLDSALSLAQACGLPCLFVVSDKNGDWFYPVRNFTDDTRSEMKSAWYELRGWYEDRQ